MRKTNLLKKIGVTILALSLTITGTVMGTGIVGAAEDTSSAVSSMLLDEDNFANEMVEARAVTDTLKEEYNFSGVDDVSIHAESYIVDNSKASIVIVPGFTESIYSYEEFIYYLTSMGYSAFIIENRGSGRSGRLGADDYMVYVESYDDYIEDLNTFIEDIVVPKSGDNKLFAYAHSMGGLIATRYLETYPDTFDRAILNSPMLAVNSGEYPTTFAKLIAAGAALTFFGNKYAAGQTAYYEGKYTFDTAGCNSEARFNELTLKPNDLSYVNCGGASYKWLYESYKACSKATCILNASKVETPILLFQVTGDTYVDTDGQDTFAKYAKNCTVSVYDDARHEIYKSTNDVLSRYLVEVFDFYED